MDIVKRVKNMLLQPKSEWSVIDVEPASTASLYTQFLIPLALVGTIARFVGLTLIGVSVPFVGRIRMPFMSALGSSAISFVVMLGGVYLWALIVNALAPKFGGQKNRLSALKLVIFASTPALVAGILSILPSLFFLQLFAALYGLYLLYIGFPTMMKVPQERAGMYTLATIGCGIVLAIVVGAASAVLNIGGANRMASDADAKKAGEDIVAGVLGTAGGGTKDSKDAASSLVAGMVAAGQRAEEAERAAKANGGKASGTDSAGVAQSSAAMGAAAAMMGSMISGGKEKVELVDFRALKELLPESGGSLTRTNASGQTTTAGGLSGSSAEGSYSMGTDGRATVKISDMGNVRGVLALGKMAFSVESESDGGFEKNVTLNGLRVHEKWNASGKSADLTAFVADRFMVEVQSHGADVGAAEKLFSAIDVRKLAASK
ncbi:MAG: Yip1 family protein [Gemmatimonadaceae bacterium]